MFFYILLNLLFLIGYVFLFFAGFEGDQVLLLI